MAFDELSFPLSASVGAVAEAAFSTDVVILSNGHETRNQKWENPRRYYNVGTRLGSVADAALLYSFFCARRGRARGFRFKDWLDYSSASDGVSLPSALDQALGVGDGTTTQFQLIKVYGSGETALSRQIQKPVFGSCLVALNGVVQSQGWSLDVVAGVVSFSVPPAAGVHVTAGYYFDVPVRFDTDKLEITNVDRSSVKMTAPLAEIKYL